MDLFKNLIDISSEPEKIHEFFEFVNVFIRSHGAIGQIVTSLIF